MVRFSIRGLESLLETHFTYSSVPSRSKRLFYDKCNWFISHIIREQLRSEKGLGQLVNIPSRTLKKHLGNKYGEVVKVLVDLKIVYQNEKYASGNFSMSYALKKGLDETDLISEVVTSKAFSKKLESFALNNLSVIEKDHVLDKINRNTLKILITQNPIYFITAFPSNYKELKVGAIMWRDEHEQERVNRYQAYFKAFKTLNESNNVGDLCQLPIFFEPRINTLGRAYHLAASMPRLIRAICVTKTNELIYEVDMASAQPSLLMLEWLKSLEDINTKEAKRCLDLVINGGIYSYIKSHSKQLNEMDYDRMKKSILTTLNAEYKPTKLHKELVILFPDFIGWVDTIKRQGDYRKVSHIGQSAEANIFINVFKDLPEDMFSLIIHDCILTTEPKTKLVQDRLIARTKEIYCNVISKKLNLEKLFKINKVSVVRWKGPKQEIKQP